MPYIELNLHRVLSPRNPRNRPLSASGIDDNSWGILSARLVLVGRWKAQLPCDSGRITLLRQRLNLNIRVWCTILRLEMTSGRCPISIRLFEGALPVGPALTETVFERRVQTMHQYADLILIHHITKCEDVK